MKPKTNPSPLLTHTPAFRGSNAAASLKRLVAVDDEFPRRQFAFRGSNAAASLKPPRRTGTRSRLRCLPRQQCRGLIEATLVPTATSRALAAFRGSNAAASLKPLIHATQLDREREAFRGSNAAASLKLHVRT